MLFTTLFVTALAAPPPVTHEDGARLPSPEECRWHRLVADRQNDKARKDRALPPDKYFTRLQNAARANRFWSSVVRYHHAQPAPPFENMGEAVPDRRPGEALTHLQHARAEVSEEDWKAGRWPVPPFCLFNPADWAVIASVH
jgi:hypothetical protein